MTFMTHIGSGAGSTWIREAIFTSDPGWGGLEAQGLLCYKWLIENHWDWCLTNDTDSCLVATLCAFNPAASNYTIFQSTIPRVTRYDQIKREGKDCAPRWWDASQEYRKGSKDRPRFHAEDGAIFGFETALDTYYPEPIEGNPPLRMVVVGVKGADRKRKPPKGKRQDLCPECSKVSQKLEIVVLNADGTISDRGRRRAEKRLIEEQEPEKKKREEEEAMFDDPDFWAAVEYSAQGQRTTQYRGLWYVKDDYGRWHPYDSSSSYASYDSGGYYPSASGSSRHHDSGSSRRDDGRSYRSNRGGSAYSARSTADSTLAHITHDMSRFDMGSSRGAGASRGATAPSSSLRPPSGSSATSSHRSASSASSSQRPKLSSGSSVSSSQTTSSRSGTVKTASSQSGARDHRSGRK